MTTWSSWQEWQDAHPNSKSRFVREVKGETVTREGEETSEQGRNEESDVLDGCVQEILDTEGWELNTEVEIEWDSSIVLARRKD